MKPIIHPPRWPLRLLRWFLKKEYVEEIEGDMEEIFHDNLLQGNARGARYRYTLDVLLLLRPVLIRNLKGAVHLTPYAMYRNYFKTSFRNLMRNPATSFINVFGLAMAIGVCVVVYAFYDYDYRVDRFHKNGDSVFMVTFDGNLDGATHRYGRTPRPLGDMLKADFAHITGVCTVHEANAVVKHSDNTFYERVTFTTPEYLQMLTFPLKWGTPSSLADINSVILSEPMAVKYFGTDNPLDREILVKFSESRSKLFKVGGVAHTFPKAHAIRFDFLINSANEQVANPNYNPSDWTAYVDATLIAVDDPAAIPAIAQRMDKYRQLQNEAQHERPILSFGFVSLKNLYNESGSIEGDISDNPPVEALIAFPVIGLFLLGLACFNYINIAIVSATRRLKEIGVRKVIGANRFRVVVQFLAENLVVTCFALVVGVLLGVFVFAPWFTNLTDRVLDIRLLDANMWLFFVAILFVTAIASGSYPALYVSRFEAATIFKGSVQFGKRNPLTKIFLGFQLVLACVLVVGAVLFMQNIGYQASVPWGYNQQHALYLALPDTAAFEKLEAKLAADPDVLVVSGATHHLGGNIATGVAHRPGDQQYDVQRMAVDARYFEAMKLQLIIGRTFHDHQLADAHRVVVNEQLVKRMGLANPVGETFEMDSIQYEVAGVVKDFYARSFYDQIRPMVFTLANANDYRYLAARVKPGTETAMYQKLKTRWATLFPDTPFDGGHQRDLFAWYFHSVRVQSQFSNPIALLAVILVALGVYGLVSLNVQGRAREFSIRKVLGAGVRDLVATIGRQYVWLTVVALAVGAPLSYVLIKGLLQMIYTYPMPVSFVTVALAEGILVLALAAVMLTQVRRVVKQSPVQGLKTE